MCDHVHSMALADSQARTDPLWLRVLVAALVSLVLAALLVLFAGEVLGVAALPVGAGVAVLSTVWMAARAKRIGRIASWLVEILSRVP